VNYPQQKLLRLVWAERAEQEASGPMGEVEALEERLILDQKYLPMAAEEDSLVLGRIDQAVEVVV
jgi:hypothetical protein